MKENIINRISQRCYKTIFIEKQVRRDVRKLINMKYVQESFNM